MTAPLSERLTALRDFIVAKKQAAFRRDVDWNAALPNRADLATARCARAAEGLVAVLDEEAKTPVFLPGERIALTRTVRNLPPRCSDAETTELRKSAYLHELGVVFNVSPNYAATIRLGLDVRRAEIVERLERARAESDAEGIDFLTATLASVDAILRLAESYRAAAEAAGSTEIAATFAQVPRRGARTLLEAFQFFRILHFSLWCEGAYHNGVGRFDQIFAPYLDADLAAGRLDRDGARELVAEFFLSFNRDSDLYVGVQQGDNGQSLMLGGCDSTGADASNLLTELALEACGQNRLIDPKINLRVSSATSFDLLKKATELTRLGLGFPQYANDDVVIPGLVKLGYDLADARDYTVAACWEFVIPGVGSDVPNVAAVSFPAAVDAVLRSPEATQAAENNDFDAFLALFRAELFRRADEIAESLERFDVLPCPLVSLLCDGRVEAARDAASGGKYVNFGIHGTGVAPAVDSLFAIKRLVFDEKRVSPKRFVEILDVDFDADRFPEAAELLARARRLPKMGNDEPEPDALAVRLLADFADSWEGRRNCRGGVFRPGTGSAMYYLWHANALPASPDGRRRGEPFPANYAPSLGVPIRGPVGVVASFAKPDLTRVVNGGPLTLELHDSVFAFADGVEKVARLVQFFVERGGAQMQLNAVNRDRLLDAQKNPEKYRNLIVRVWGWSGYFVELDRPYQDQIIRRAEITFPT